MRNAGGLEPLNMCPPFLAAHACLSQLLPLLAAMLTDIMNMELLR